MDKIIICEGLSDKQQIAPILNESVEIILTNGSFSIKRFDYLLETYDLDDRDVYIFVDADNSGEDLRRELKRELPHARDLYASALYEEVALMPRKDIAKELIKHNFEVNLGYLLEQRNE